MGVVVKRNLGERANNIALRRGIPFITVETIIKDYLKDLADSAARGERIVIDGLTSITIVHDLDTGDFFPRGRVSPALRSKLLKRGVVPQPDLLVQAE